MKRIKKYFICFIVLCFLFTLPISSSAAAKVSIKLNKTKATVYLGKTLQLKASVKGKSKKVVWKSSNKAIATVSSKGKVVAKKTGKVRITAKANGKVKSCVITVKKNGSKKDYSKYTGTYEYKWPYPNLPSGERTTNRCYLEVTKAGKVRCVLESFNSWVCTSNIQSGILKNNIVRFRYKDSWGGRGNARITLKNGKVTIKTTPTYYGSIPRGYLYFDNITLKKISSAKPDRLK